MVGVIDHAGLLLRYCEVHVGILTVTVGTILFVVFDAVVVVVIVVVVIVVGRKMHVVVGVHRTVVTSYVIYKLDARGENWASDGS